MKRILTLDRSWWSHFLATEVTPTLLHLITVRGVGLRTKSTSAKRKLLARILHAFAQVKECPNQLRSATQQLSTRAAKCIEVDDRGCCDHVLGDPDPVPVIVLQHTEQLGCHVEQLRLLRWQSYHHESSQVSTFSMYEVQR
ncbi:hypothetical protein ANN_18894 [Periplaneta americana]|uniref:Uncharacterized protein n=1 Tax=Periplaneta americana TaxID=6978 RepID=A0ABQ8SQS1_PERAM|nr:hypothetical protein ANN_18894 [Periplaneta americana]